MRQTGVHQRYTGSCGHAAALVSSHSLLLLKSLLSYLKKTKREGKTLSLSPPDGRTSKKTVEEKVLVNSFTNQ